MADRKIDSISNAKPPVDMDVKQLHRGRDHQYTEASGDRGPSLYNLWEGGRGMWNTSPPRLPRTTKAIPPPAPKKAAAESTFGGRQRDSEAKRDLLFETEINMGNWDHFLANTRQEIRPRRRSRSDRGWSSNDDDCEKQFQPMGQVQDVLRKVSTDDSSSSNSDDTFFFSLES